MPVTAEQRRSSISSDIELDSESDEEQSDVEERVSELRQNEATAQFAAALSAEESAGQSLIASGRKKLCRIFLSRLLCPGHSQRMSTKHIDIVHGNSSMCRVVHPSHPLIYKCYCCLNIHVVLSRVCFELAFDIIRRMVDCCRSF